MKIKLLSYKPVAQEYMALNATGRNYELVVMERRVFGLWARNVVTHVYVPFNCSAAEFYEPKVGVWVTVKTPTLFRVVTFLAALLVVGFYFVSVGQ